jgi:acetate kinase
MGTRCGDLDPAILFYLGDKGYDVKTLNRICNKQSGLLGLSGVSNDVRSLVEIARQDDGRAKLAVDVFCYRIKKYIGAYAAVLDTVDALVFTGGIGENAVGLREQICSGLTQIGVTIDEGANSAAIAEETEISTKNSRVRVLVIPTNEQAAIANDTYELSGDKLPAVSR